MDLTIHVYRGKSFMLPRDKVHPEPFSKIDHDGAGHGYLETSTINVENFSVAILSLCSLFDSTGCIYVCIKDANCLIKIEEIRKICKLIFIYKLSSRVLIAVINLFFNVLQYLKSIDPLIPF